MFYILNNADKKELSELLAKIEDKILGLNAQDIKSLNKIKHLNECKDSIKLCLNKSDEDKYDFFIYHLYTIIWGFKDSPRDEEILNKQHCPSLKELATQEPFKMEVESFIESSKKFIERQSEFDENNVPLSVSSRQAKLALYQAGLLDKVQTLLQEDKAAEIEFEYATEIERNHHLITSLQKQLKLSKETIDELFKEAKKL